MPNHQGWMQSVYEGPQEADVALCQLRTGNGGDIVERCQRAWQEGRPVRLDYPDDLRLRQQVDVVALRLTQIEEGEVLLLWVTILWEEEGDEEGEVDDDFDPDIPF